MWPLHLTHRTIPLRCGNPCPQALLFTNAATTTARVNITLRVSFDDGGTWPVHKLISGVCGLRGLVWGVLKSSELACPGARPGSEHRCCHCDSFKSCPIVVGGASIAPLFV